MSLDQYKLTFPDVVNVTLPLLKSNQMHDIAFRPYGDVENTKKLIITVHGLTGDSLNFHYFSEYAIQHGFAVVNIDIMGRNASLSAQTIDPTNFTYAQYLADIVGVLKYVREMNKNQDTKWYWAGTSMGGLLGMLLSSQFEQLAKSNINFSAFFFNDIGPLVPWDEIERISRYVVVDAFFETQEKAVEYFEKLYSVHFGPKVDVAFFAHRALYALQFSEDEKVWKAKYDRIGVQHGLLDSSLGEISTHPKIGKSYSVMSFYKQLKQPLLVYRGALSSLLPAELLVEMEDVFKNEVKQDFKSILWENTGHVPPLYQTDEFVPIIEWFNKY